MKVLMVEPGYAPYETEINGLRGMQAAVGGLIQAIYPFEEQVAVVCNDEGLINGMPFNRSMPGGYSGVCGPFFVCGLEREDFCSLTPDQMEKYRKMFFKAELLVGTCGNDYVTLQVPPKTKSDSQHKRETPPHERE